MYNLKNICVTILCTGCITSLILTLDNIYRPDAGLYHLPYTNIINENKQLRLILLAYIKTLKDVKAMAIEQQRLRNGGDNEDNGDQEEGEEENESQ